MSELPTSSSASGRTSGSSRVFHRLWHYGRRYRLLFGVAIVTSVLLNLFDVVRPWLLKSFIDRVLVSPSLDGRLWIVLKLLGAMFGATVMKGLFTYLQGLTLNLASQGTVRDLRTDAYDHLLRLPVAWFDRRTGGDVITRFTEDVAMVSEFLTLGLTLAMNDGLVFVASLSFMVSRDWKLTLVALTLLPLAGIAGRRYARRLAPVTKAMHHQMSDLSSLVHETVSGIHTVKSFNREDVESERFRVQNDSAVHHAMRLVQLTAKQLPIMEVLATGGFAIVIWYSTFQLMQGKLTHGDVLAFWAYILLAATPINRLPRIISIWGRGCTSAARLFEILDQETESTESEQPAAGPIGGNIQLRNVHFRYAEDREEVLRGLDLDIAAGEHVAIVGRNGAGKSTFANLLPRFYTVPGITLDGRNLGDIPLSKLRRQIGIVPQEGFLFAGTIRDNIAYGRDQASDEEVEAAARAALAHDFILALEGGYSYPVEERGGNLSGGQRQRIAIARMLLTDPTLIVLDEATASLDAGTEEALQRSLEAATRGRTVLNVAHRVAATRNADRIIVLDQGRVVESGTHQELLERRGLYWDLFAHSTLDEDAS